MDEIGGTDEQRSATTDRTKNQETQSRRTQMRRNGKEKAREAWRQMRAKAGSFDRQFIKPQQLKRFKYR